MKFKTKKRLYVVFLLLFHLLLILWFWGDLENVKLFRELGLWGFLTAVGIFAFIITRDSKFNE